MQHPSTVQPSNAPTTDTNFDKIDDWESDRITGPLHTSRPMQPTTHFVLCRNLIPITRPHSRFRRGPANIQRNDSLYTVRIEPRRNSAGNGPRLNKACGLKTRLIRSDRSTVRLHNKQWCTNSELNKPLLQLLEI